MRINTTDNEKILTLSFITDLDYGMKVQITKDDPNKYSVVKTTSEDGFAIKTAYNKTTEYDTKIERDNDGRIIELEFTSPYDYTPPISISYITSETADKFRPVGSRCVTKKSGDIQTFMGNTLIHETYMYRNTDEDSDIAGNDICIGNKVFIYDDHKKIKEVIYYDNLDNIRYTIYFDEVQNTNIISISVSNQEKMVICRAYNDDGRIYKYETITMYDSYSELCNHIFRSSHIDDIYYFTSVYSEPSLYVMNVYDYIVDDSNELIKITKSIYRSGYNKPVEIHETYRSEDGYIYRNGRLSRILEKRDDGVILYKDYNQFDINLISEIEEFNDDIYNIVKYKDTVNNLYTNSISKTGRFFVDDEIHPNSDDIYLRVIKDTRYVLYNPHLNKISLLNENNVVIAEYVLNGNVQPIVDNVYSGCLIVE